MRIEKIGDAALYLGDCRDVLGALCSAQCTLTDPPFGIAYSSGHATDALWSERSIRNDEDSSVRDLVLAALPKPCLAFGSPRVPCPPGTRARLIWDKGPALGMGALDIPWKPSYEEIYVIGSGFVGPRDEGAVIYCPPVQSMAKNGRVHPNEKPVQLLKRLLRKMPDGAVADPFMGSGSTGVACVLDGRPFVGCEIDPKYFDIACKRIEEATRQPDMFVSRSSPPMPSDRDMFEGSIR